MATDAREQDLMWSDPLFPEFREKVLDPWIAGLLVNATPAQIDDLNQRIDVHVIEAKLATLNQAQILKETLAMWRKWKAERT
jgi:hypothetical protein